MTTLKDRIMQLADGTRTSREIAEQVGCHTSDVLRLASVRKGQLRPCDQSKGGGRRPRDPSSFASAWSAEKVELLKNLWADGYSCSQIASRIGGVSRNAVIGKVRRLGLSSRAPRSKNRTYKKPSSGAARAGSSPQPQSKSLPPMKPTPFAVGPEPVVPEHERRGVADLTSNQCRWPIGDPRDPGFHFCNGTKVLGAPHEFCMHHLLRAMPPDRRARVAARYSASPVGAGEAENATDELGLVEA